MNSALLAGALACSHCLWHWVRCDLIQWLVCGDLYRVRRQNLSLMVQPTTSEVKEGLRGGIELHLASYVLAGHSYFSPTRVHEA